MHLIPAWLDDLTLMMTKTNSHENIPATKLGAKAFFQIIIFRELG